GISPSPITNIVSSPRSVSCTQLMLPSVSTAKCVGRLGSSGVTGLSSSSSVACAGVVVAGARAGARSQAQSAVSANRQSSVRIIANGMYQKRNDGTRLRRRVRRIAAEASLMDGSGTAVSEDAAKPPSGEEVEPTFQL